MQPYLKPTSRYDNTIFFRRNEMAAKDKNLGKPKGEERSADEETAAIKFKFIDRHGGEGQGEEWTLSGCCSHPMSFRPPAASQQR